MSTWREVAARLADRLQYHAHCDTHDLTRPDLLGCPFCMDRDAYLQYLRKSRTG